MAAPYEALKTSDGYIVVGVNRQGLWLRFCEAIGEPTLAKEPLFANGFVRVANREELKSRIETILQKNTTAHWLNRLLERGIPAGPINNVAEALNDPQVKARGMLRTVGDRRYLRTPLTLSLTPVEIKRGAAEVGEHTREVLVESGLTEEEADALFERAVVSDHAVKEAS